MIKITLKAETKLDSVWKEVMVEVVPRRGDKVHIPAEGGRLFTVSEVLHSFGDGIPEIDVTMNDVLPDDIVWLKENDGWI